MAKAVIHSLHFFLPLKRYSDKDHPVISLGHLNSALAHRRDFFYQHTHQVKSAHPTAAMTAEDRTTSCGRKITLRV